MTTAAVGEVAGYSRGIVNHHFGSRDQLMVRLAEATQRRFVPRREGERRRARAQSGRGLSDDAPIRSAVDARVPAAVGVTDGSVRVDPAAAAVAVVGLIRGIAMQSRYDPALAESEQVRVTALAILGHGISAD